MAPSDMLHPSLPGPSALRQLHWGCSGGCLAGCLLPGFSCGGVCVIPQDLVGERIFLSFQFLIVWNGCHSHQRTVTSEYLLTREGKWAYLWNGYAMTMELMLQHERLESLSMLDVVWRPGWRSRAPGGEFSWILTCSGCPGSSIFHPTVWKTCRFPSLP